MKLDDKYIMELEQVVEVERVLERQEEIVGNVIGDWNARVIG